MWREPVRERQTIPVQARQGSEGGQIACNNVRSIGHWHMLLSVVKCDEECALIHCVGNVCNSNSENCTVYVYREDNTHKALTSVQTYRGGCSAPRNREAAGWRPNFHRTLNIHGI